MQPGIFTDLYEVLQVSANADPDTIHRVFRILAQRWHPDNAETGNGDMFRQLTEAHSTLSDPDRRAAYDVQHREARRVTWKIFDQTNAAQGAEAEKRKRQGILQLLYRKRLAAPDQPSMALHEFEELLGVPKEHLEFSLWYLREGQYVHRSDNGKHSITLKGVNLAETMPEKREHLHLLMSATHASNAAQVG